MKILIAGASGFLGSALTRELQKRGDDVSTLVRREARSPSEIPWRPDQFELDPALVRPFEAIVNLSGESLMAARWSPKFRETLFASRIKSTRTLVRAISPGGPKVLVSASGAGFYGYQNSKVHDESDPQGAGFVACLAAAWETETFAASARSAALRFGVILGRDGGALKTMLPLFKLGLGGKLGSGTQAMSWISLTDAVQTILFVLDTVSIQGPINATSPNTVSNAGFTASLGKALRRPAIFTVPSGILKALLGQMAEETILADLDAVPKKLLDAGFVFKFPNIDDALRHELSGP